MADKKTKIKAVKVGKTYKNSQVRDTSWKGGKVHGNQKKPSTESFLNSDKYDFAEKYSKETRAFNPLQARSKQAMATKSPKRSKKPMAVKNSGYGGGR